MTDLEPYHAFSLVNYRLAVKPITGCSSVIQAAVTQFDDLAPIAR